MERCYSELIKLNSYQDRLNYLILNDNNVTSPRDISEKFYKSDMWKHTRHKIIMRDLPFDLGIFGIYIYDRIFVHHINPIDEYDIKYLTKKLTDPENLIVTSLVTHNIIHYGTQEDPIVERQPGDTILW